jgi:hypothetical protein
VISGDGSTVASNYGSSISVFDKPVSGGWQDATQIADLTSDAEPLTSGLGISQDGSAIIVGVQIGEPDYDGGVTPGKGAAYEFREPTAGGWQSETETAEFNSTEVLNARYLFYTPAAAISGDGQTVVVGSPGYGPVVVYPSLPVNAVPPVVSGGLVQGQTLTETNGLWSGTPTTYFDQWEDCDGTGENCSAIAGAHSQSYTLTGADVGSTVVVQEIVVNVTGWAGPVSSTPTQVVQALSATSAPRVGGQAVQGQTLTETHASWNTTMTGYAYRWERCDASGANCSAIGEATGQSYTLTNADAGHAIVVQETASNIGGAGVPAVSASTAVVIPLPPTTSAVPTISGTAVEGNPLTASLLVWTNRPTGASYRWEDCDSNGQNCQPITGATSETYTLAPSDIGKRIVVEESATNAGGTSAPAASTATGAIPESGPVGLEIDNGDYATDNPNVTIEAAWPAGTQSILISNNGGFRTDTQTVAPAATIDWTLEQTGADRLPKTVYVRFLGVGQDDINFTDDIVLDETAPTVQSATVIGPGTDQASAARAPKLKTYKLRLKAEDKVVGVCEVATSQRRSTRGEVLTPLTSCKARGIPRLSRTLDLKLETAPHYVRVENSAGDWSRWIAAH